MFARRQGCYGSEDIAVITPYLGQLLLLRQELQRHTLVRLEEADAAQLADLADKSAAADDVTATADQSAAPAPSPAADGASSTKGNPLAAEAAATVQRSSLQSCVRLATVDNFQGELIFSKVMWAVIWLIVPIVAIACYSKHLVNKLFCLIIHAHSSQ